MNGKHLYLYVKSAIRTLKGRRREPAAFLVAALCFSGGVALGKLLADKWITRLQIAMYAIGAIAFVYGVVRVWKLVNPPELPPAKDRPSAIKGPMAFTEADGELFRKLERESELQKLLGFVLDDQILMIVVRGASGAGKTSLLRAGLKHILGDRAVLHYWEAVPTEPDKGLLRAIQERWPEGATKPTTLAELVNPSDGLGRQAHVIVLDQFEQLRGSRKIFQLLRRIIRESKPPHRISWVIAFRLTPMLTVTSRVKPSTERSIRVSWHDADDGVTLAVEKNRFIDEGWIAAELALPQTMAKQYDMIGPDCVFFRKKAPSEGGRHIEGGDQIDCDLCGGDSLRLATACKVECRIL